MTVRLGLAATLCALSVTLPSMTPAAEPPNFTSVADWPKPLPNGWTLGGIAGIAIDDQGHVWVNHFVGQAGADTAVAQTGGSKPQPKAPTVLEFDSAGELVSSWGGPGQGYDWPTYPHGLFLDHQGYIWLAGNHQSDGQVLKFTRDGKFVLQIGAPGGAANAANTTRLSRPANLLVEPKKNELYVADGYGNRRIIVFDAETGKFKRMWGAYGKAPVDARPDALDNFQHNDPYDPEGPVPEHFNSPIHCVVLAKDGLVYACDRTNNRVQVFDTNGRFVREFFFDRVKPTGGLITDVALWPDRRQSYLFAADSNGRQVLLVDRETGDILRRIGKPGTGPGEIELLHVIAMDRQGNLYTGDAAKRLQKWTPNRPPE